MTELVIDREYGGELEVNGNQSLEKTNTGQK